ncbi:hypothetical protein COP2_016586 [Malus domestica]
MEFNSNYFVPDLIPNFDGKFSRIIIRIWTIPLPTSWGSLRFELIRTTVEALLHLSLSLCFQAIFVPSFNKHHVFLLMLGSIANSASALIATGVDES